jgi:hypothetical protein
MWVSVIDADDDDEYDDECDKTATTTTSAFVIQNIEFKKKLLNVQPTYRLLALVDSDSKTSRSV